MKTICPEITCPDCRYLIEKRAAIHEFDGKATQEDAERMAATERCATHQPELEQALLI